MAMSLVNRHSKAFRFLVASLVIFLLLAGCTSTPETIDRGSKSVRAQRNDVSFVETIDFYANQVTAIALEGTGWARLKISAAERLTINVTVENAAIPFLDRRAPENGAIYNVGNFTSFYLFHEDSEPRAPGSFYFDWHGDPLAYAPDQGRTNNGSVAAANFSMAGGTNATLLVATSIAGYVLTLDSLDGPVIVNNDLRLRLRDHPGLKLYQPPMQEVAGQATPLAEASHSLLWSTGILKDVGPSISWAWGWTIEADAGTGRARLYSDRYGFDGVPPTAGSGPKPQFNGPSASIGSGSRLVIHEPAELEMYRLLEETSAGVQDKQLGALFLTIPLE